VLGKLSSVWMGVMGMRVKYMDVACENFNRRRQDAGKDKLGGGADYESLEREIKRGKRCDLGIRAGLMKHVGWCGQKGGVKTDQ